MRRTDLPPMPHCSACGECCTVVKARPEEAKRIRAFVREHDVKWEPPDLRPKTDYKTDVNPYCGFLRPQPDGTWACAVYPVRPWGCRAFGVIADMQCEYFPEDAVANMSAKDAVMLRVTDPADRDLGEYFEPGYLERIASVLAENANALGGHAAPAWGYRLRGVRSHAPAHGGMADQAEDQEGRLKCGNAIVRRGLSAATTLAAA